MAQITITEALAELKTISKRLEKKRELVMGMLWRNDAIKDPFEKDGGSIEVIKRERQAIADLDVRRVAIRTAIQQVNHRTAIVIAEESRTIAEWLTWRKEVAPGAKAFNEQVRRQIAAMRTQAQQKGWAVVGAGGTAVAPMDLLINIDESLLAREAEMYETVLGTLDGQLSLKNATVMIDI